MRLKNRRILGVLPILALAGCGGSDAGEARVQPGTPPPAPVVADILPVDQMGYDEVGYASWYGNELAGNKTGNGEVFSPQAISGAHRTLPMPSFVEVTNLDTGRTILVRINDRGPFARDRILDLSQGAARQLGVEGQGHFPVRVRRVNPPEHERTALRNGEKAVERLETPPALLNALRKRLGAAQPALAAADAAADVVKPVKPVKPVAAPARPVVASPVAAPGRYYVQVGSFSTEARAAVAAKQVGGDVHPAGKFWRVRTGPFANEVAAKAALGPVAAKGYRDARITR
jgi:rare lipoprotein A